MRSALVVVSPPVGDDSACIPKAFKPLGVETFVPHATVEAFAERVLNGVPPQNPVDRRIVDVSALGVELASPDASLAVRPGRDRQIEPSATHVRVRALSAESPSRSSRLISRGGTTF